MKICPHGRGRRTRRGWPAARARRSSLASSTRRQRPFLFVVACVAVLAGGASADEIPATVAAASPGPLVAPRGMVAAEHELAARAGAEILAAGGNAMDAAVATAFATGVVNPSSCGIGGGGFLLVYDARRKTVRALDFRERAPAAATRDMFLEDDEVDPARSVHGGLAVGTPGEVRGLAEALETFGTMPLARVLEPAIRLAAEGFPVGRHLARVLARYQDEIRRRPALAAIYLKNEGAPFAEGDTLVEKDLAGTLRAIADGGPDVFYEGPLANRIAAAVREAGGILSAKDLRAYRTSWREPLTASYRGVRVAGFPPPSSGGGVLLEALNVLGGFDLGPQSATRPLTLHLLAETEKLVFADRAAYYGDPDFVDVPLGRLLSSAHADRLRARIRSDATISVDGPATLEDAAGTAHLSTMDRHGNAVALTSTINTAFGSLVVAPGTGIVLNNQMDDFSAAPGVPNVYGLVGTEANSVQPGKRPLSSMSPTLVLRGDHALLAVGGSGGPRIITATLQTVLNVVEFGMSLDRAIAAPRIHHQWRPDQLAVEKGIDAATLASLRELGHSVREVEKLAAVQAVLRTDDGFVGMADPRKGGGVAGW